MSSTALFRTEAELARVRIERGDPVPVETSLGRLQLRIVRDPHNVETPWRTLQKAVPCTSAQTYDWAQAWTRHVLVPEGSEPAIAAGFDAAGQIVLLWPFEMKQRAGLKVLNWLGQDHANYNMGLFAPEAADRFGAADLARLLDAIARRTGAVAMILKAQPYVWDGVANPLAKLPHQAAPSSGYAVTLGDFAKSYTTRFSKRSRTTLERKERKLLDLGALTYGWAETPEESLRLMDIFFAQKARQFAALGIKDIFDAHARAFYREVALLERDNPSRLRLGYVKLGDDVLATFSGTLCHKRMIVALSSLAEGETQRQSPGALLLRQQIKEASDSGIAFYDIGVGAARHKDEWADVVQPLFDSFLALTPLGHAVTLPLAVRSRLKRAIKSSPHLWPLAQKLRTRLFGRGGSSA